MLNGLMNCLNGRMVQNEDETCSYESVKEISTYLLSKTKIRPKLGLICGTGMGAVAHLLQNTNEFPYESIPNFPKSTVHGHAGKLIFGFIGSVPIMCMQGRVHYYEGYSLTRCALPVRVMKMCGVTHIIMSNAAGGVNANYSPGDIMLMKDHVNFLGFGGVNPLRGTNDERWGPRFVALNKAYSAEIRSMAKKAAAELGMNNVHEGVYALVGGPNFETVAEIRLLRQLGVDAVGMSTVGEVITAHHCGIVVFAFSLITNACVCDYVTNEMPNHEEVLEHGKKNENQIKMWITKLIEYISKEMPKT
ncbi:purine nucleoside phosphorylase [Cimex lectularius]|uniref:Purine nucleoside phosphorylase n=1 Tax=Cimex lectularius TaxID=79782 RepID=A0A8I6TGX4_CIMLE|nr:purine nucleoside phosphorylase [Cimex lectularius]